MKSTRGAFSRAKAIVVYRLTAIALWLVGELAWRLLHSRLFPTNHCANLARLEQIMATQHEQTTTPSLRGRMLIASPSAENSPYRGALVLLLEHNAEGAIGIVLDGSFAESLDQLREQLPRISGMQQLSAAGLAVVPVKVAVWQASQLDQELESGLWFHAAANPAQILFEGVPPWRDLVREVGRSVYRDALGITEFPGNVWLN